MASRKSVLIAVLLPLLAISLGIVRAQLQLGRARDYVFDIQGFDPRDLLRGRFLQFRLQVDDAQIREACDPRGGQACCLCLTRGATDQPPQVAHSTCEDARAHCDGVLQPKYLHDPLRFYVAEAHANQLDKRLADAMQKHRAQVILAIDANGEALVRELLLDGKAIPGGVAR